MARLWSSGFELNSAISVGEFTAVSNLSIVSSPIRNGGFSGRITGLASGAARGFLQQFSNGASVAFARFYFRYATLPSAANSIFNFDSNTTLGGVTLPNIKLTSTGTLQLFNGATQIGSDSAVLDVDTWYLVEVEYNSVPAAGSQVLNARLNETQFAGASNLTLAITATVAIAFGGNLLLEAQTTGDWFFDDIAINDNTGSFENSWPGPGNIVHLKPNAAGDNSAWTNDWQNVDEVTPDDATSFCASGTLNEIDDHNLEATPAAMASGATIDCVQVGVRYNVNIITSTDPAFVLRIKSTSGGTVEEGTAVTATETTWRTNKSLPSNFTLTLYDLPGASSTVWTKADLDTAQIGYRCSTGDIHLVQVSTVWLLVEYNQTEAIEVNVSPVTLTLSQVTPLRVEQYSLLPQVITLTQITPLRVEQYNLSPQNITLFQVTPLRVEQYNLSPLTITLNQVTPQLLAPIVILVTPLTLTLNQVTPLRQENYNLLPQTIILSQVTPLRVEQYNLNPLIITLNQVTPSREEQYNLAPQAIILNQVTPLRVEQYNLNPQTIVLSQVTPLREERYNLIPQVITLSQVNLTREEQYSLLPLTITLSQVTPLRVEEYNLTPLIVTLNQVTPQVGITISVSTTPLVLSLILVTPLRVKEYNLAPQLITLSQVVPSREEIYNLSPQTLFLNLVDPQVVIGVIGGVIIITTPPPILSKTNLFAAFVERLKFVDPIVSEFVLENTAFPYISLCQLSNVLSFKNTCLERFEESNFRLSLYYEDFEELELKIKDIEDTLIYSTLLLTPPKKVIFLQQIGKDIEELIPQLYRSQLIYEILVQKQIDLTYTLSPTSGDTLNKAIYKRFKTLPLSGLVNGLVSPAYALENTNFPYIVVPKISEDLIWHNTKGRIDGTKYPFTTYSEDRNELIDIMDEVERTYDYCRFDIADRQHMITEWVGTEIMEVQPQLWCGKVNYEILCEREITSYS